jgi:hypothetical protein
MAISKKTGTIIMGLFIISLMVGSLITFGEFGNTNEDSSRYEYNGYVFAQMQNGWAVYKDGQTISLRYGARELETYDVKITSIDSLNILKKIYFSTDPRDSIRNAVYDFDYNVQLNTRMVPACTVDIEACKDAPLKTCDDADDNTGVIIFKNSNDTKVTFDRNCLVVEGSPDEIVKVTDKLILNLKGVTV